jgi:hypothetical protein
VESFNGKLRDELLNPELFDTLLEARVLVERWRRAYNAVRATDFPVIPGRAGPWNRRAASAEQLGRSSTVRHGGCGGEGKARLPEAGIEDVPDGPEQECRDGRE